MAQFPVVGDEDVEFELYIAEDGRHLYAITVDGTPLLGFDAYGGQELVRAIQECITELSELGYGGYS